MKSSSRWTSFSCIIFYLLVLVIANDFSQIVWAMMFLTVNMYGHLNFILYVIIHNWLADVKRQIIRRVNKMTFNDQIDKIESREKIG